MPKLVLSATTLPLFPCDNYVVPGHRWGSEVPHGCRSLTIWRGHCRGSRRRGEPETCQQLGGNSTFCISGSFIVTCVTGPPDVPVGKLSVSVFAEEWDTVSLESEAERDGPSSVRQVRQTLRERRVSRKHALAKWGWPRAALHCVLSAEPSTEPHLRSPIGRGTLPRR